MKFLELFSGSAIFSKTARERGHDCWTIDNDPTLKPDECDDITELNFEDVAADVIWASPPCQGFSVAAFGKNWGGGLRAYIPKSESAKLSIDCLRATVRAIEQIEPTRFFIENPMGMMRKMPEVADMKRVEVSYCRYGDTRMKPTDIFTDSSWLGLGKCKNGSPCHTPAPRGSKTPGSTQGIKGAFDRGKLPPALCLEIITHLEKELEVER